ncbi:MAG: hypothetical protein MI810_19225 [Flavobacteriales bacterium]|nr:hypothetical protein [Flavobacteriales bacterium]
MEELNLIFLRGGDVLLSNKSYKDWKEIQDEYEDYMTSMEFDSLEELSDFIQFEYQLSAKRAKSELQKLTTSSQTTVKIEL